MPKVIFDPWTDKLVRTFSGKYQFLLERVFVWPSCSTDVFETNFLLFLKIQVSHILLKNMVHIGKHREEVKRMSKNRTCRANPCGMGATGSKTIHYLIITRKFVVSRVHIDY